MQTLDPKTIGDLIETGAKVIQAAGPYVIALIKQSQKAPKVFWGRLGREEEELDPVGNDIALLVQISQPIYVQVKEYLDEQGIIAPLYVISHEDTFKGEFLDNEDSAAWSELVQEFGKNLLQLQNEHGNCQFHLFISGPATLAFAMGARVSRWQNIRVYNRDFNSNTYVPVLNLPSDTH